MAVLRQCSVTYLPDDPLSADTEFAFIDGQPFVNASKHEVVIARHVSEVERLRAVEKAARALDALFDEKDEGALAKPGGLDEWKLGGRRQTADVSLALLSLHDRLNDVAREALDE